MKVLDENHPRNAEYKEKWDEVVRTHLDEIERIRNLTEWSGRDHPLSKEINEVEKRKNKLLKELMEEYKDCYIEVEE